MADNQTKLENYVNDPSNISYAKRILKQKGNENPTSEDIGYFLTEEFNASDGERISDLGKMFKKVKNVLGLKKGGMVNKRKKKIKMAGRIAKRGYGKARK